MFNTLYYTQTYCKDKTVYLDENTQRRFLIANYMGSAEFEFGSIGRARRFMHAAIKTDPGFKRYEVPVQFERKGQTVTQIFHLLTNAVGVEKFKEAIHLHLDGKVPGSRSKEYTGIYDIFAGDGRDEFTRIDLWFVVTGFIQGSDDGTNRPPIVFTDDKALLERYHHQLMNEVYSPDFEVEKLPELKIGDLVLVPGEKGSSKVAGLNEDDTITVRTQYKKKTSRWNRFDLWKVETE